MPAKIRLQRFGKKGAPFYHIVVSDSRAPRDGRYIEKLGIYNPLTKPATIDIDFERSVYWVKVGAQPTDTAKAILSYKGVLYRHHLNVGVVKGAMTQEQADAKFDKWLSEKQAKIEQKSKSVETDSIEMRKAQIEAEKKVRAERDKALQAKRQAEMKAEAKTEDVAEVEEVVADVEEAPVAEETVAVAEETPVAEVEETPAVEDAPVAEEPVAEVEETPAAEEPATEEPKTEE
ncbi:MAG: 30S ribosomal protein S16 [Bacteroidetes bacterium HGW-Bacteroidetes-6]|jgi:small subunit ribosomal protein S16|nr:MAG: 30S ribosomal protein S16 [Bacteroidetes bacterium HGW-Bacteroidetes-6]